MNKMVVFTKYQTKLLLRNYKTTAIGFLMPVLMFVIFSNVFADLEITGTEYTIVDYLLPAFIPIIIINAVIVIYGHYYSLYEEQGNLLKYRLLGLNNVSISFGIFLATLIFQILAILALIATAIISSDVPIPYDNVLSVLVVLAVINLFQFAIVYLVSSITTKSATYQSISIILFNFQMFLGGLTFPPEMFPNFLRTIVEFVNPIYYGLIAMRGVWTEKASVFSYYQEIGLLVLLTAVFIVFANFVKQRRAYT
ncbi:ABC transporter permease [Paucisalibacillus sp. EB02]|uniref:ABC transporter permease n=1 Tax=Paucisalibacillus sp. EB02 TaxID=1347087 RepID=UPI0004BA6BD1|nr:ABC transporter permease [Paucisalibacillus sp. EB02]